MNADETQVPHPNVSAKAAEYLNGLKAKAADLLYHALAVLYAPSYRAENASGLRNDWPRIPLPTKKDALLASGALGLEIAALLDPEGLAQLP